MGKSFTCLAMRLLVKSTVPNNATKQNGKANAQTIQNTVDSVLPSGKVKNKMTFNKPQTSKLPTIKYIPPFFILHLLYRFTKPISTSWAEFSARFTFSSALGTKNCKGFFHFATTVCAEFCAFR